MRQLSYPTMAKPAPRFLLISAQAEPAPHLTDRSAAPTDPSSPNLIKNPQSKEIWPHRDVGKASSMARESGQQPGRAVGLDVHHTQSWLCHRQAIQHRASVQLPSHCSPLAECSASLSLFVSQCSVTPSIHATGPSLERNRRNFHL